MSTSSSRRRTTKDEEEPDVDLHRARGLRKYNAREVRDGGHWRERESLIGLAPLARTPSVTAANYRDWRPRVFFHHGAPPPGKTQTRVA